MRKRFLSYITMVIVIFVVGVNVVKAEDYNFSTKIYKVDVVDDNFITRFNNGEFQEVKSGGTLNAGDTIAVGIYLDVMNANATNFDFRLNWDDSTLVPIKNSKGNNFVKYDDDKNYYWTLPSLRGFEYYRNNKPLIVYKPYKYNNLNADTSLTLFWVFFDIKEDAPDGSYFTFDFSRAFGYGKYGKLESNVTNTSSTFKINGKRKEAYSLGDVNGNGVIDFGDVMLSMAFYMIELPIESNEKDAADINGDGRITLSDNLLILDKLKGE